MTTDQPDQNSATRASSTGIEGETVDDGHSADSSPADRHPGQAPPIPDFWQHGSVG
ncbi:MAG: hypothetical protein ACRDQU_07615 [Pseudonocardiaceae bacterium]